MSTLVREIGVHVSVIQSGLSNVGLLVREETDRGPEHKMDEVVLHSISDVQGVKGRVCTMGQDGRWVGHRILFWTKKEGVDSRWEMSQWIHSTYNFAGVNLGMGFRRSQNTNTNLTLGVKEYTKCTGTH